jgi:16S rRNA (uracil1498-N3)-methyltransferase
VPAPFVLLDTSFADVAAGADLPVDDDTAHHLAKVLRLREGAAVEVSDGMGRRADATLTGPAITLRSDPVEDPAPTPTIHVLQGLPQGRKHDEVVRMLTELGVDRITAVVTERTQSPPDAAKGRKQTERWQAVARAACEQARRSRRPIVDGPIRLDGAVAGLPAGRLLLAAHLGATVDPMAALPSPAPDHVVVAVGPEGGWSPDEADRLAAAGARLVSLGQSVLRTEHAALVLAAVVAAATGRMRLSASPWE